MSGTSPWIAVEIHEGKGEWFEVPYRLEDGKVTKSRNAYVLEPGSVKQLAWDPGIILARDHPPDRPLLVSGNYRINVHLVGNKKEAVAVSSPFSLVVSAREVASRL